MQRNTIFLIAVKALRVSGGFPAHHQELKNRTYSIWYLLSLVAATASGSSFDSDKEYCVALHLICYNYHK
jgi:hypothetical protein